MFRRTPEPSEERDINSAISLQDWVNFFSYQDNLYPVFGSGSIVGTKEEIGNDFSSFVTGAYKSNGIVFACMALRLRVFSDIRFGFRDFANGRPGKVVADLDGRNPASKGLSLLQNPWPGGTTGDLLAHMIQDVDLSGNAFVLRQADRLTRLRPDWMTIVMGSNTKGSTVWDLDAELLGYLYQPGGKASGKEPIPLHPDVVAHWAPMPDPLAPCRGMSWLTPILREVTADKSATQHELAFFQQGGTVNYVMEFDKGITKEQFELAKETFNEQHVGLNNAWKTLFLLGATTKTIGSSFKDMDFTALQGRFETRIASAAGIHPVLTAFSEGLQGSSLNAGNFSSARRATADMTFRPLWRNLCGSLAHIIETPPNKELWYFDDQVQFLQEDQKDAAAIELTKATEIEQLLRAGFVAESVVEAVMAQDLSLLKHSGLFSVQLQAPGSAKMPQGEAPGELPVGPGTAPEKPPVNPVAAQPANGKAHPLPAGKP